MAVLVPVEVLREPTEERVLPARGNDGDLVGANEPAGVDHHLFLSPRTSAASRHRPSVVPRLLLPRRQFEAVVVLRHFGKKLRRSGLHQGEGGRWDDPGELAGVTVVVDE